MQSQVNFKCVLRGHGTKQIILVANQEEFKRWEERCADFGGSIERAEDNEDLRTKGYTDNCV